MERYTSYKKAAEDYNTRLLPKTTNKIEYIKEEKKEPVAKEDTRLKGREKKLIRKRKPGEHFKMYPPQMGYFNNGALNDGGKIK